MLPKPFSRIELKLAGALGTGPVKVSDLEDRPSDTTWHFFQRNNWEVGDEDYELLLPSMRLASWLLEVGMPYLVNFLPSDPLHTSLMSKASQYKDFLLEGNAYTIPLRTNFTSDELRKTRKELGEIAKITRWEIDPDIYALNGWLGITITAVNARRPWAALDRTAIETCDADLKKQKKVRRSLIIGITREYVHALRKYPTAHEAHSRAIFWTAVTMAHEVAHAVWHQDFKSIQYSQSGREPWVSDDTQSELGLAFISWIFSGFTPEPCDMGDGNQLVRLQDPLAWKPRDNVYGAGLYEIWSSIPVSYLEKVTRKAFWDELGNVQKPEFSVKARAKLHPMTTSPREAPAPATAAFPLFNLSSGPRIRWKRSFDMKVSDREIGLDEVTGAEIEYFLIGDAKPADIILRPPPGVNINPQDQNTFDAFMRKQRRYMNENSSGDQQELGTGLPNQEGAEQDGNGPPGLEPFDGYLAKDLGRNPQDQHHVVKILVGYWAPILPGNITSSLTKRPRDDDDDEGHENLLGLKKPKKANAPTTSNDLEDIHDLLARYTTAAVARSTHVEVDKYCQKNNIAYSKPAQQNAIWKKSQLQIANEKDAAVIQRIRHFELNQADMKYDGNLPALIRIKEARLLDLGQWAQEDLKEFLANHGQSLAEAEKLIADKTTYLPRVTRFLQALLDIDKRSYKDEKDAKKSSLPQADVLIRKALELWSDEKLKAYIRSHSLSDWGGRDAWLLCVLRHQKEAFEDGPQSGLDRHVQRMDLINQTTDGVFFQRTDGVERYGFKAIPSRSSVTSLKTKLLEVCYFPLNAVFQLYVGDDRKRPLDDALALSSLSDYQLSRLQLVVRIQSTQEQQQTASEILGGNINTGLAPPVIGVGPSPGTKIQSVAERTQDLTADTRELIRAGQPRLRGKVISSASQMLRSLQDLDAARKLRNGVADLTGDEDTLTPSGGVPIPAASAGATPIASNSTPTSSIDLTGDDDDDDGYDELNPIPKAPTWRTFTRSFS